MVKNKSLMRKIFRLREKAKAFVNFDTLPVNENMKEELSKQYKEAEDKELLK